VGIRSVPKAWSVEGGDFNHFSWDSAFWVFNFVANYAYSRYCDMIKDIQKVQRELEGSFFAAQKEVEETALALYKQSSGLAKDYLTKYSHRQAEYVLRRWRKLGEFLIWKYLDGNVKDEFGRVTHPGYPKEWYRRIVKETGDKFLYREKKKK
jgi:dipeptidase